MLGKKDKSTVNKTVNTNQTTLVSAGAVITGDVEFKGNLELEGVIIGRVIGLDDKAAIRIVQNGKLEGELQAPRAVINGTVVGDVHISQYVELAVNARIDGDLYYSELEMAKGARINGRLIFTDKQGGQTVKPVLVDSNKVDSKKQTG